MLIHQLCGEQMQVLSASTDISALIDFSKLCFSFCTNVPTLFISFIRLFQMSEPNIDVSLQGVSVDSARENLILTPPMLLSHNGLQSFLPQTDANSACSEAPLAAVA